MNALDGLIKARRASAKAAGTTVSHEPLAFYVGAPHGWVFAAGCPDEIREKICPTPAEQ